MRELKEAEAKLESDAAAGLITPEQLAEAKSQYATHLATLTELDKQRAADKAAREAEERAQAEEAMAAHFQSAIELGQQLSDEEAAQNQQRIDERLRLYDLEIELGYATQEQKLAWIQEELENWRFSYEERLRLEAEANEVRQAQAEETGGFMDNILRAGSTHFKNFLTSVMTGQQTFGEAFSQLWKGIMNAVIQEIVKAIIKATLLKKNPGRNHRHIRVSLGRSGGQRGRCWLGHRLLSLGGASGRSGQSVQAR